MANEILQQIPTMTTSELWEMYSMEYQDNNLKITTKEYEQVKYGYQIQFDIRPYIRWTNGEEGYIKNNPKQQSIQIKKKQYTRHDFDDELEIRKATMRKTLQEIYEEQPDTTESRTK